MSRPRLSTPLLCLILVSLLHVGALASLLTSEPVATEPAVPAVPPVPAQLVLASPVVPVRPTPVPVEPVTPATEPIAVTPARSRPSQPAAPEIAVAGPADPVPAAAATTTVAPVAAPTTDATTRTEAPDNSPALSEPVFDADYLNNPAPPYPSQSKKRREQGVVWLRVHVTADGQPDQLELLTSSGFERLDDAALRTVRRWQFVPARQGDAAVAAWVRVPVRFALQP